MDSPGLGAFFAGQRQASTMQNEAMARQKQQGQLENLFGRLRMDQEAHPGLLEQRRLQNEGLGLGNEQDRFNLTEAQRKQKMDQANTFFRIMAETDDVELAFTSSGVPRTGRFAEFAQLPREQRNQFYQQWAKGQTRAAEMQAEQAHQRRMTELQEKKRLEHESRLAIRREATAAALQLATLRAAQAQQRAAATRAADPNIERRFVELNRQLTAVRHDRTLSDEARAQEIEKITEEMNVLVTHNQDMINRKAQADAAKLPQIGPGGTIAPGTPPPVTGVGPLLGQPARSTGGPETIPAPAIPPMPPGAVRPRQ